MHFFIFFSVILTIIYLFFSISIKNFFIVIGCGIVGVFIFKESFKNGKFSFKKLGEILSGLMLLILIGWLVLKLLGLSLDYIIFPAINFSISAFWDLVYSRPEIALILFFVLMGIASNDDRNNSPSYTNKFNEYCEKLYNEEKQKKREQLEYEIRELEQKRNRIDTGYGIFLPNGLSDAEREHNIQRREVLDDQIKEKKYELNKLDID